MIAAASTANAPLEHCSSPGGEHCSSPTKQMTRRTGSRFSTAGNALPSFVSCLQRRETMMPKYNPLDLHPSSKLIREYLGKNFAYSLGWENDVGKSSLATLSV